MRRVRGREGVGLVQAAIFLLHGQLAFKDKYLNLCSQANVCFTKIHLSPITWELYL